MGKVTLDEDLLFCRDIHCVDHRDMICDLYSTVILSCIKASKHIPTTSKPLIKVKPGWNDNVQKLKDEALSYHRLWKSNGCPREGYLLKCVELLELVIIELFDILRKMLTLYEWERWLMLFCLTNQEICGVNVLK